MDTAFIPFKWMPNLSGMAGSSTVLHPNVWYDLHKWLHGCMTLSFLAVTGNPGHSTHLTTLGLSVLNSWAKWLSCCGSACTSLVVRAVDCVLYAWWTFIVLVSYVSVQAFHPFPNRMLYLIIFAVGEGRLSLMLCEHFLPAWFGIS